MTIFKVLCATSLLCLLLQCPAGTAQETTNTADSNPVTQQEIDRLTKAIEVIEQYYITKVNGETLMNNAISGMVTRLDPHSAFLDKKELSALDARVLGEFVGIGVELTTEHGALKVIAPIAGSPAQKAGLKPGDLIVKVDNKLIQDMTVSEAIAHIQGKAGTSVVLTILRKNEPKPLLLTVMRDVIKTQAIQAKLLAPGYGDIHITQFQNDIEKKIPADIALLKKESGGSLKGLVLDLRNNPGGLLDVSAEVANLFLDKKDTAKYNHVIVYTKGRLKSDDVSFVAHNDDLIPHVPMVVLINSGSASASEVVAGALQDYKRAIIMGTRSFGKGSVQTVIPLSKHTALKLTTALYYTPSGREIQARGIEPNVLAPELSVDEKKITGLLDLEEGNYNNHIMNHTGDSTTLKASNAEKETTQKSTLQLAKDDYQLYEAFMMLKGAHAMQS